MVDKHYRWDFIGLSTDSKPTPATSEKVADGSTYYEGDTSKLYIWYGTQWYEKEDTGGGSYELPIAAADTLGGIKVGSNLSIDSETGVLSATDTTYSNFVGTDGTAAGTAGLVPAPATTDSGKFLKADGTWDTAGGGGPTVVQGIGSSTTDVMSQKAVTDTIFIDSSHNSIRIGNTNTVATYAVCLGNNAHAQGTSSVGIGDNSSSYGVDSVAVGYYAVANGEGDVAIGKICRSRNSYNNGVIAIGSGIDFNTGGCSGSVLLGAGTGLDGRYGKGIVSFYVKSDNDVNTYGYNGTHYRLIMGVHDPQSAHDAATKGYVDSMHAVLYANSTKLVASVNDLEFYKEASLTTKWTAGDIANLIINGADITIVVKNPSEDDETARFTLNMLTGHSPKTPTDETLDEVGLDMFAINCQTGTKYRMTSYGPLTETNWSVGSFNL